MSHDFGVVATRPGLSRPVSVAALRDAVANQRSWRGVLRTLGFTTSRTGRVLREVCDELDVDYSHFGSKLMKHPVEQVVQTSTTWAEVLARLGFAPGSGSARATIRRHCQRHGIDVSGLTLEPASTAGAGELTPQRDHLRHAGPYLVAGALTLAGAQVSLAPEGAAYDLIADVPGMGPKRVQVKTVMSGSWQCGLSRKEYSRTGHGGHRRALYSAEDIDFFACVTFERGIFLIPIAAVEGRSSISLRRYRDFRLPFHEVEGVSVA